MLSGIKEEKEVMNTVYTNHQRLKFNDELLYHVVKYAERDLQETFQTNAVTKMLKRMFDTQLDLCVEPFNTLNADGDITELYEQYPMMIRLFAVGNKPKIVRAGFFLLAELIHLVDERPDILPQLAESSCQYYLLRSCLLCD